MFDVILLMVLLVPLNDLDLFMAELFELLDNAEHVEWQVKEHNWHFDA